MLDNLLKDKRFLTAALKYTAAKTASKNITDVYISFLKLAASGELKEMLSLPQTRIKDILLSLVDYESKKASLRKVLDEFKPIFLYVATENLKDPNVEDRVIDFMQFKYVDYMVDTFLQKYNGKDAKNFELLPSILAVKKLATEQIAKKQNVDRAKGRGTSLEGLSEEFGAQFGKEDAPTEKPEISKGDINALEDLLKAALDKPSADLSKHVIGEHFLEKIKDIKDKSNAGQDVSLETDQLFEKAADFLSVKIRGFDPLRTKKYNVKEKNKLPKKSMSEIDQMIHASDINKFIDEIANYGIDQTYLKPPTGLQKVLNGGNPNLAKNILKSLIQTHVAMATADFYKVSIPGSEPRAQGGYAPMPFGRLLHLVILDNLKDLAQNPEELDELVMKALGAVNIELNRRGDYEYPTNAIKFVSSHAPKLALYGLIEKFKNEDYGGSLANLSPEDVKNMAYKISNILHNSESAHLPHAPAKDKYQNYILSLNKTSKDEVMNEVKQAIQNAVDKETPLTKQEDTQKSEIKESSLSILIKKYASIKI